MEENKSGFEIERLKLVEELASIKAEMQENQEKHRRYISMMDSINEEKKKATRDWQSQQNLVKQKKESINRNEKEKRDYQAQIASLVKEREKDQSSEVNAKRKVNALILCSEIGLNFEVRVFP